MSFQQRVQEWLTECFSHETCYNTRERCHRFTEEALELVQSLGMTESEVRMLVDYVYGRPTGEPSQEVGGTMVCLAALCTAEDIIMDEAAEIELSRAWHNIDKIRAKNAQKPKIEPDDAQSPL